MKLAFLQRDVTPIKPVCQAGFINQTEKVNTTHDFLYARVLGFMDSFSIWISVSVDSLGMPLSIQNRIQAFAESYFSLPVHVTISATHTHFAGDAKDHVYQEQLCHQIIDALQQLDFKEYSDLSLSEHHMHYDEFGRSRISAYVANPVLHVLRLYSGDKPLVTMVIYNCHPTVNDSLTPYFTAEYPGFLMKQLQQIYPQEFFTFYQSSAGDISTRFTRHKQTMDEMEKMCDSLCHKVIELMEKGDQRQPVESLQYSSLFLPVSHQFNDIEAKDDDSLSQREKETLQQGILIRQRLSEQRNKLDTFYLLSAVEFGNMKLVFAPNELFSWYNGLLRSQRCALICYSNGYSPYVTPPKSIFKHVTYERFFDTLSEESKMRLIEAIKELGK